MGRQLTRYVCVTDPASGEDVWVGPGSEVPGWAVEQITHPGVWDTAADDVEESEGAGGEGSGDRSEGEDSEEFVVPAEDAPRAEWAAFLAARGVQFAKNSTRDGLVERWRDLQAAAE